MRLTRSFCISYLVESLETLHLYRICEPGSETGQFLLTARHRLGLAPRRMLRTQAQVESQTLQDAVKLKPGAIENRVREAVRRSCRRRNAAHEMPPKKLVESVTLTVIHKHIRQSRPGVPAGFKKIGDDREVPTPISRGSAPAPRQGRAPRPCRNQPGQRFRDIPMSGE